MTKVKYEARSFTEAGLAVAEAAAVICQQYADQGYNLTLRQLYYRFIATDAFPESRRDPALGTKNTERNYKWLGDLVSNARIAGLIDWSHMEDRTRNSAGGDGGWDSPAQIIESSAYDYTVAKWIGQPERIEVWVEKEALADVVSRPANRWNVPYFACKGYVSQSEMHAAAVRLRRLERDGLKVTVIHLGDHDPSGLDMTEDIRRRLEMFRCGAAVKRIALNMDQVEVLNPPPSPAKITDSRAAAYIEEFHDPDVDEPGEARCWELDAIEPAALEVLVEDEVRAHLVQGAWDERLTVERREKAILEALHLHFGEVTEWLRGNGYVEDSD